MSEHRSRDGDTASADTLAAAPATDPTLPVEQVTQTTHLGADGPVDRPSTPLPTGMHEGASLGRFKILDMLGSGGMGVVLAAHDPQLDRKVAIKVLRARGLRGERRAKEAARLLREARTMAQLTHPNVVTVYEAGTIDDRVYIAMEYVAGPTLRHWLAEGERSVAEILDAYTKAGRGLAAGHAAGLIHRDFKPDNVLVGEDGRVRVIDFGLARPSRGAIDTADVASPAELAAAAVAPSASSGALDAQLTTVGGLFGTPRYMAPEQHQRIDLDARTDQFAFCVALYEALYKRMPFDATTYLELSDKVNSGEIVPPPENADVPAHVVKAVLRGLRSNRDERFPSMDALLAALETPTVTRRRSHVWPVALGACAAVLGTIGIVALTSDDDRSPAATAPAASPCAGGEQRLAGIWDAPTRKRIETAFAASTRRHAKATFDRVATELDRYTGEWIDRRRNVCEATKVRGEQSDAAFDLRMHCLRDQLEELRALSAVFANAPDTQVVDKAIAAVRQLPDPDRCVALAVGSDAPLTPEQREAVEDVRRELANARALHDAGKHAAAVERAKPLVARATTLANARLQAEVHLLLGRALSGDGKPADAERELREAVRVAALAKDDVVAARAWTQLIWVVGFQLARHADALALEPVAEAAIERADGDNEMSGDLAYYLGSAHFQKGDYPRAKQSYEKSLELRTGALGEQHPAVAQVHNSLGGTLLRAGDLPGARKHLEKSLEIRERSLGPDHPDVMLPLANLGALAQAEKRFDDAATLLTRAAASLEEIHGPDHANVGLTVVNLGHIANERKDCVAAAAHFTRALGIFEKLGPSHPYVAMALIGRADCRVDLGAHADAIADAERALSILSPQTSDPGQLAEGRFVLARGMWAANRDRRRARELAKQARETFAGLGPAGADGVTKIDAWLATAK